MRFEAQSLRRTFGSRALFEDLSFSLGSGQTLAVLGPSGTGKSQLLRALAWLDPLEAGSVRLDGRIPSELGIPTWRARVAYVPQVVPELRGTPAQYASQIEALQAQRGRSNDDAFALASSWGLSPESWRRPWSSLSGGERQRAYLALRLARRPDVLLLDEPTSALDAGVSLALEASLRATPSVWVTHDAAQAGRVATQRLELGP